MNSVAEQLRLLVGASHVLTEADDLTAYVKDWTGKFEGRASCVVQPRTTQEVAAVLAFCHHHRITIVPQGGNTGMSGGATPDMTGQQVILSLRRMSSIRAIDPVGNTITAEAGTILATIQSEAEKIGRFFPLSLGAEGSCTIGGNLATNAGGIGTLRYGNAREQCLGLEVVLADGRILDTLTALRKDNSGYDLRDLFIGSEGTLGIITAAVLKLQARPRQRATAVVALKDMAAASTLLMQARDIAGDRLVAFEYMNADCLALIARTLPDIRQPFVDKSAVALIELADTDADAALAGMLETLLSEPLDTGLVQDVLVANSEQQRKSFWQLRESISPAQLRAGKTIKHDISLPLSALSDFVAEAQTQLDAAFAGLTFLTFGHLGDGNLHYNLLKPTDMAYEAFASATATINEMVHDLVVAMGGSISAEHGIGQLRRDELARHKSPVNMGIMQSLKSLFDERRILNPDKLLPTASS